MNKISTLFSKHLRNVHFLLLITVVLVIILANAYVVPTIDSVILSVFHSPFTYLDNNLTNLKSVTEKNSELTQALNENAVKLTLLDEARLENERLRSILGFEKPPRYKLIPAEIISVSGDFIPVSVRINKGSADSVEVDQTVINQQGLVGRVSMVGPRHATVQLLTDPSNRVASRVVASREMGIIKYSAKKGMILDNFPIQGTIFAGDTIKSSGLGGIYPEGLLVGTVSQVVRQELEPFCDVSIDPAANFYSLEELFILKEESE